MKGSIIVKNLSKDFKLPHEKTNTLKGAMLNFLTLRRNRTIETQKVLDNISLLIKPGEFFGVLGRNGSGKSTLLKILAGIYQSSSGEVSVEGKLVPFIELGVGFNGELSGRDNVYLNGSLLGFSKIEMDKLYDDIVEFAELENFMDQKLKNYSSGMQVRLAFSIAIRTQADILLIDEVLAVGDAAFQRKCLEYFKELKANKKTVVFVTHDMNAVREYCDRAILIEDNKILHSGSAGKIADAYSRLFVNPGPLEGRVKKHSSKRWGTEGLKVISVKTRLEKDEVVVELRANIKEDIDRIIYGLHILSQDGSEVTAMNNRMINKPDIKNVKADSELSLTWRVLNVFNDGRYSITITMIDGFSTALDWITGASSFTVKRMERSTTAILPPVKVNFTLSKTGK